MGKKKRCSSPCDSLVNDGISGNFRIQCGESDVTVWSTTDVVDSAGTISVYYGEGCADELLVTVIDSHGEVDTFFVPAKNTRSRTYTNLAEVRLTCLSGNIQLPCMGSFCLKLNYFV